MNFIHFGQIKEDLKLLDQKIERSFCSFLPECKSINPTSIDVSEIELDGYINTSTEISPKDRRRKVLGLYDVSTDVDNKTLKKSIITPDFEAKPAAPVKLGKRVLKKMKQKERLSTAGNQWFHMKPPELNDDLKRDYEILQMRSLLNPKRFYKSNDRECMPKYFQVGKVMDNAADFYSSRICKKERKQTLADELLADAQFQKYRKKKMSELVHKRKALATKKVSMKKRRKKEK